MTHAISLNLFKENIYFLCRTCRYITTDFKHPKSFKEIQKFIPNPEKETIFMDLLSLLCGVIPSQHRLRGWRESGCIYSILLGHLLDKKWHELPVEKLLHI